MSKPSRPYRLGAHTRRLDGGRLLVGGRPPRSVRLTEAGAEAVDAALAGREGPPAPSLIAKLVSYGLLDPIAEPTSADAPAPRGGPAAGGGPAAVVGPAAGGAEGTGGSRPGPAAVTFVVPVRDGGPELGALVAGLAALGAVIVVDDGSTDGSPELAREAGATVVANDGARGPGGARNTGWRLATTEFVAFIDADCVAEGDWARPLAALLEAEPRLALAAPRIRGTDGPDRLARWERACSPLDMGADGGLVGPGRAIAYVPSAALVARRAALEELGGFDASLRFGEDVDLAWRAVDAGWEVRYAPELVVRHPPRATLGARARQHFGYGSSAAALDRRHPGAVVPLRPSRMMVPSALLAAGFPVSALLSSAAISSLAVRRRPGGPAASQDRPPRGARTDDAGAGHDRTLRRAVADLAVEAQLGAGRQLGRAVAREWLPLAALALARGGRARRFALTALAIDLAAATAAEPSPVNAALRLLDDAAYSAGVWRGAIAHRSPAALLLPALFLPRMR
jgi:mycofactocin system glycosyltransferase